jgi:hypothetical protein
MNHQQHLETFVSEVNIDLYTYFRTSTVNSKTYMRLAVEVNKTLLLTSVTIIPFFLFLCIFYQTSVQSASCSVSCLSSTLKEWDVP